MSSNSAAQMQLTSLPDFSYQSLCSADVEDMFALQQRVYDGLPEEKKSWIVTKSVDNLTRLTKKPNHAIGCFNKGVLIGLALLEVSSEHSPLAGLTDCPALRFFIKEKIPFGVPKLVIIDEDYRGRHLSGMILKELGESAKAEGLKAFIAEVAVGNDRSENSFLHQGYEHLNDEQAVFTSSGNKISPDVVDPIDGTPLIFLRKSLHGRDQSTWSP